jgi:tetratricopeptide (TPR) repeat protein
VQASPEKHLSTDSYEADLGNLLCLQDEVAREVAEKVGRKIIPGFRGQLAGLDPEAQGDYLKSRYFWNKRTEAGYLKAVSYFQNAIERSPRYGQAYAGLADTYALLGSMANAEISRSEAIPKAKAAASSALQLDDSLAEAHPSLAFVKMHCDWDWKGAEREFRRAIELNPNYVTAHHWYAYDLLAMNRMPAALNETFPLLMPSCTICCFAREAQQAVAMLARFRQDQKAPQHSHAKPVTPLSDTSRD